MRKSLQQFLVSRDVSGTAAQVIASQPTVVSETVTIMMKDLRAEEDRVEWRT